MARAMVLSLIHIYSMHLCVFQQSIPQFFLKDDDPVFALHADFGSSTRRGLYGDVAKLADSNTRAADCQHQQMQPFVSLRFGCRQKALVFDFGQFP